jgi:hypothetical protein
VAELLGTKGGVIASAGLSNEAFAGLQRLTPRLPAALWPAPGEPWPVEGSIENLARCKAIVLVGLDVWNELPILALWIRKAVVNGATLVVLGDENGLWRNTTHWLKGDPLELAKSLSTGSSPTVDALRGQTPAALLAHPSLVERGRAELEALATAIGADGASGLRGAPLLGANGRGASDLAPDVARGSTDQVIASSAILAIGDEDWAVMPTGSFARLILATSQPSPVDDPRVDVVLPMAHAYERQATITNLEGRVQHQEGGASPIAHARADWSIVASLAGYLGIGASTREEAFAARA